MKFTLTTLFGLVMAVACNPSLTKNTPMSSNRQGKGEQGVINQGSSLKTRLSSDFQIKAMRLKDPFNLRTISFSDEAHGWVGSETRLFKTVDGGATWNSVRIQIPKDAEIAKLLFVSPKVGWVVLQIPAPDHINYGKARFSLMKTTDSGETWQVQLEGAARINDFSIANGEEGWLAGVTYTGVSESICFLAMTSDSGGHWNDLSSELNKYLESNRNDDGRSLQKPVGVPIATNDTVRQVSQRARCQLDLITGREEVLTTSDCGRTWQLVSLVRDELESQAGVRKFGIRRESHWILAATDSEEGTRTVLTVQGPNSWTRYTLQGVYQRDAVRLSDTDFLSGGYERQLERRGDAYVSRTRGIILHSQDRGANWAPVYRGTGDERLNIVTTVGENRVWAAGEKGLLLRLDRLPAKGPASTQE